jgi:hypothetical protein
LEERFGCLNRHCFGDDEWLHSGGLRVRRLATCGKSSGEGKPE